MAWTDFFKKKKWRWIDHTSHGLQMNALHSFAYDDTFCESVGLEDSIPIVRTWVHQPTVVLGTQDSRLPNIHQAIDQLEANGSPVIVRNSGGLAVYLDPGILNISLIMKDEKSLDIDASYNLMFQFTKKLYHDAPKEIFAGEIIGSYCPGNYDLSINNLKFAGVSQRRLRNGIAVQVYLALTGSGKKRAEIIRHFYETATNGDTRPPALDIQPETMASLSELYEQPLTVADGLIRLQRTFRDLGASLHESTLNEQEKNRFQQRLARVYTRNDKVLGC